MLRGAKKSPHIAGEYGRSKPGVLVIDDDRGILQAYRVILERAGYGVATASSGGEAIGLLASDAHFHLIVTELRLRDMSGLEVLAASSATRPAVPVVMISACWTEFSELASKRLGAAGIFNKSADPDRLVETVGRTLQSDDAPVGGANNAPQLLVNHAASRWATIIVPVTRLKADPATIAAWGNAIGRATATLKVWCAAAGVHAGDSLDFARLLRVVTFCAGRHCDWHNILGIVDSRTLVKILGRGGMSRTGVVPSLGVFLGDQQFVTAPPLLSGVRTVMERCPNSGALVLTD